MPENFAWNNGHPYWTPQSATSNEKLEGDAQPKTAGQEPSELAATDVVAASFQYLPPVEAAESPAEPSVVLLNPSAPPAPAAAPPNAEAAGLLPPPGASGLPEQQAALPLTQAEPISPADGAVMGVENAADLPRDVLFTDPYLRGLVQQALVGNQELRILAEEIQIANNEAYARSGEYLPFVTLGGRAGADKPGQHTRAGAVEDQLEVAPGKGFSEPLPDFLVGADVSWEIDIWKRLRNAQRAAAMRYLATREGQTFVVTRLVAEIADKYYELLALDARRENLEKTIQIQQASLEVAQAKKEAGRGTELAVQRFEAEVRKNQSELSVIMQDIVEVENRVNFLVGRYPQPVDRVSGQFVDLNLYALSAGVPSDLLLNRADIRQAEREVAAAGLDVQVARARFYPSLSLTAGVGWNAFSTGYLFRTPESLAYGAFGELVGPLINKRAIQAAYRSANAAQLQSIYNYQQTVLEAHIEVVNFITKVENYRRSIESKKQQLDALAASVDAATKLFESARAEYVEVLLAQRELMEARMQLIDIKREQLTAIVNAYQALGGGAY